MFLGALYSWIYHNKQQVHEQYDIDDHYIAGNGWSSYTTSPSATHISNDITPTTTYTIGLPDNGKSLVGSRIQLVYQTTQIQLLSSIARGSNDVIPTTIYNWSNTCSYDNLNRLITKTISSMTASLRFEGELNVDLNEFQTNLVPFPRLHFMNTARAPVVTKKKMETQRCDIQGITESCFSPANFFTKIADFDAEEDKYMAISVNYRGDVKAKEANATVQWLKTNKKVCFVEWCPTGFKVGLNDEPPAVLPEDDVAPSKRNIVMIGNKTISRVFSGRISNSQRAFVHWYVGEGMEEDEFAEAREDLGFFEV